MRELYKTNIELFVCIVVDNNQSVKSGSSYSLGFASWNGIGIVQIPPRGYILRQWTHIYPIFVYHTDIVSHDDQHHIQQVNACRVAIHVHHLHKN